MHRLYRTQLWQVCLPDPWQVREDDGPSHVTIYRPGAVGELEIIATDDIPTEWRGSWLKEAVEFRGQLSGKTGILGGREEFCRWWNLYCCASRVTLYVVYRYVAHESESQRSETNDIVQSLSEISEPTDGDEPPPHVAE